VEKITHRDANATLALGYTHRHSYTHIHTYTLQDAEALKGISNEDLLNKWIVQYTADASRGNVFFVGGEGVRANDEGVGEETSDLRTSIGVAIQTDRKGVTQGRRDRISAVGEVLGDVNLVLLVFDLGELLEHGAELSEGWLAVDHLIEHAAERPDVVGAVELDVLPVVDVLE
jgi:hypothetical protein